MREVKKRLTPHSKVIEVGCGTGQTLDIISRSSNHITFGFDSSREALSLAEHNCHYRFQGDIFHIPFKDNTFDLVYNSGVIEHFPNPSNLAAVKEMARITKPGGTVIVIVPNAYCIWYRLGKRVATLLGKFEFGYEEDYSPVRLSSVIENSGLMVERSFGLQVLPPLATNDKELLPESIREWVGCIERIFPLKQFYAYTTGIVAKKR